MYKEYEIVNGWAPEGENIVGKLMYARENSIIQLNLKTANKYIPFEFRDEHAQGIEELGSNYLNIWIEDRVFPPYRQNANSILEKMGLKEYDIYNIFIYCKGQSVRDGYYIREV